MSDIKTTVRQLFNQLANDYEKKAWLTYEVGQRLLERLDYMRIAPQKVLDLGSGSGQFGEAVAARYPDADVVAVDLAEKLLQQNKVAACVADAECLPFASQQFDLVFANLSLPWSFAPDAMLLEMQRVLKPGGLILFSSLGPDTLKQLNQAVAATLSFKAQPFFSDMHDLGDMMVKAKLADPVVDMEMLQLGYQDLNKLITEVEAEGLGLFFGDSLSALEESEVWQRFCENYHKQDDYYPLSYEIIYGHAWGSQVSNTAGINDNGEVSIAISSLRRKP